MTKPTRERKKLFISYAHNDGEYFEVFKNGLISHLFTSNLYDFGTWEDSKILIGTFWHEEIQTNLKTCDIALLCVSANFLNSKYIKANEFSTLINEYPNTLIVPVYFNHCNIGAWEELAIRQFFKPSGERYGKGKISEFAFTDLVRFRETDGKPIPNSNSDLYFTDLCKSIENRIDINKSKSYQNFVSNNIVPKASKFFTGRHKELEEFASLFYEYNIISIEGLGGTGKSEFIAKFIERLPLDKIVWLTSNNDSSFESLIEVSGYSELLKVDKSKLSTYLGYKTLIERDSKIIIIDNFQEIRDNTFVEFLKYLKNSLQRSKILLISKEKINIQDIDIGHFRINGLANESLSFIKRIKNVYNPDIEISDDKLLQICNDLAGHPFAIILATQLLVYENDVNDILQLIHKYIHEKEVLSSRLLDEVFNHSRSSDEERELLLELSAYRGTLSKKLLEKVYGEGFRVPLRKLIDKLMISVDNKEYRIHSLVREFCYFKLENHKQKHYKAFKNYIEEYSINNRLQVLEEIFHHLQLSECYIEGVEFYEENSERIIKNGHDKHLISVIELFTRMRMLTPRLSIIYTDIGTLHGINIRECLSRISFAIMESPPHSSLFLEAKITEAELLMALGELANPAETFKILADQCKTIEFKKGRSVALTNQAICFINNDQIEIAISLIQNSLQELEQIEYFHGKQFALMNLAYAYYREGRYEQAIFYYNQLLKEAQLVGYIRSKFSAENGLAMVYSNTGQLKKSLEISFNLLNSSREIGDKFEECSLLLNIALTLNDDKNDECWAYLEEALELSKFLDHYEVTGRCYLARGDWYLSLKNYEVSIENYLIAYAFKIKLKGKPDVIIRNFIGIKNVLGVPKFRQIIQEKYEILQPELKSLIDIEELLFQPVKVQKLPGRNDFCYCGSGLKFKKCHGKAH